MAVTVGVSKAVRESIERVARDIFDNKNITYDRELMMATASQLLDAVKEGYGMDITDVEYNSPDWETLGKITENVYSFSAAKNYHELRDMTDALRDGDRIRSFEEFRQAVEDIDAKYNGNWLRTEYNQAIAASQCGARWNEFKRNAKAMPMLQYQAVMDSNTREDHAKLNGVRKRVDDPFWDIYMPPNGWGCRCEVIQLPSSAAKETPSEKIIPPAVPKMFQINFGKRGIVFPQGHAYFKRLPKEYEYKLKESSRAEVRRILDNAEEYQRLKNDKNYTDVEFDWGTGGLKATHKDHNFDKDIGLFEIERGQYEKNTREALYEKGYSIILQKEDLHLVGVKQPDGFLNGTLMDIKGVEGNPMWSIFRANGQRVETCVLYFHEPSLFSESDVRNKFFNDLPKWMNEQDFIKNKEIYVKTVVCVINNDENYNVVEIKKPEE